jgi:hypothetical protein
MMVMREQEKMRAREFGGYVAAQQQRGSSGRGNGGSGENMYAHNHPYQHHPGLPRTKSMPLPYHPQSSSPSYHPSVGGGKRGAGEWSEYADNEEDNELFYQGIDPGYEHRSARPRERRDAVTSASASAREKPKNHSQSRKDNKEEKQNSSSRKRSGSVKSITSFFTRDNTNPNAGDISISSTTATTPALTHASSSLTTMTDHTPSPRDSWALKPAKYTCVVIHPCKPPTTGPNSTPLSYFSFPFFTLKEGQLYDVLQEAGHPSLHPNLPLIVDEGEDCLLLCRSVITSGGAGEMRVGWALASFLKPCSSEVGAEDR